MIYKTTVNTTVLEKRASDHAIIKFETPLPLVSANVMCSGEGHDPEKANAFRINPCEAKGRLKRFKVMIEALVSSATNDSIIALQEFPRRGSTGVNEFTELLQAAFKTHRLFFGKIETVGEHRQSQLCMLVLAHLEVTPIPSDDPRIQVLRIGWDAYINLHPMPPCAYKEILPDGTVTDGFQTSLLKTCKELQKLGCSTIFIVGDWNRREKDLHPLFKKNLSSPPRGSHYPPPEHLSDYLKSMRDGGPIEPTRPVDHLSVVNSRLL